MKKWPLEVGRVALSRAGRDEGRKFLVIQEIDADFVFVADGKNRGIERPKKKRRSHLKPLGRVDTALREKLLRNETVENHEVRKSLSHEEE